MVREKSAERDTCAGRSGEWNRRRRSSTERPTAEARGWGCGDPELFAPYWSGFGGIRALLMPNGVVYYYVSDNAEFPSMAPELQQGRAIGGPLC